MIRSEITNCSNQRSFAGVLDNYFYRVESCNVATLVRWASMFSGVLVTDFRLSKANVVECLNYFGKSPVHVLEIQSGHANTSSRPQNSL